MRKLIIIALLLFTVSIAWAGKAILLVDQTSGDYYESVAEADIEAIWSAIEIYTSDDDYTDWVLQYMIADDSILKAFFADEDWGDMTVSGNTITLDTDSVGDSEIDYAAVNMDDMTDGSTNAAITLTQETAYDAVVTADPSDYDEYSDLPVAVITDNDTTHIPNCENVFEFCETTQAYLQSADISAYMQDEDINTFSELQLWASDKTLVNEEDAVTWDALHGFSVFPTTPSSAPTTDYQMANKKYVDDNAGGGGSSEFDDQGSYLEPKDAEESIRTKSEFQVVSAADKIYMNGTTLSIVAANQFYVNINSACRLYGDGQGNWTIGGDDSAGTAATNTLVMKSSTVPTSSPANVVQLYVKDTGSAFGSEVKLVLNLNGTDGATSTTDTSPSEHTMTFNGTAQLDTAEKKWGTASLLLDGNSDYLSSADSADWDIVASNSDNWTIDFWIKLTDHFGTEMLVAQLEDSTNSWYFYHNHGDGIKFQVYAASSVIIDVPWGGEITDTSWHHIALCKVGSEYGIYKDGTQVGYVNDSSTVNFTGELQIGTLESASYFDGSMDEIRIIKSNFFSATPNATPDDTITVPTSEYSGVQAAELYTLDESENETIQSPHNASLYTPDEEYAYMWSYCAKNKLIGKRINVDMYGAIKAIEEMTGKKFIYTQDIPVKPLPEGKKVSRWLQKKIDNLPFEEVYRSYPKQDDWHGAKELYDKSVKTEKDKEDIKTSLRNYKKFLRLNAPEKPVGAKVWFKIWKIWVDWEEPAIPKPPVPATGNPTPLFGGMSDKSMKIPLGMLGGIAGAVLVCAEVKKRKKNVEGG